MTLSVLMSIVNIISRPSYMIKPIINELSIVNMNSKNWEESNK